MYLHGYGKSGHEIATNTVAFTTEFFPFVISGRVANLRPAFTVKIKGLIYTYVMRAPILFCTTSSQ